uniref:TPA induced trans-membrane protein n=1 Tax=Suricata suricatta TaxID=37032 RepID=A0A673SKM9_SURSU
MEGAGSPLTREELELSVLGAQPDEQKPLYGTIQVIPLSVEEPREAQPALPASQTPSAGGARRALLNRADAGVRTSRSQPEFPPPLWALLPPWNLRIPTLEADKENLWSSCNKTLIGKCKLWMVIASVFLGLIVVIIISLCLIGATYIDEDENEILELSSNKTFLVMLKVPEDCVTEGELPEQLRNRLTAVYSSSPSLSRYFTSVEITDFSGENTTVAYHLQFGVPSEDDSFMKYMMSKELVLGILLQDLHDQRVSGCETLGLDPTSLLLHGKSRKSGRQSRDRPQVNQMEGS